MITENSKVCYRDVTRIIVLVALLGAGPVLGQEKISTFGAAVSAALESNPAVVSAYYNFEAAREGQRSAE